MNYRFIISWLVILVTSPGLAAGQSKEFKEFHLKLGLDPLLDLSKAWALTAEDIEKQFGEPDFKENPFIHWSAPKRVAEFSRQPYANISVDLTVFDGALPLNRAEVVLDSEDRRAGQFSLTFGGASPEQVLKLRRLLTSMLGSDPIPGPRLALGWKADLALRSEVWHGEKGVGILQTSPTYTRVAVGRAGGDPRFLAGGFPGDASRRRELASHRRGLELFVRIDQLLPVPGLWSMTPDDLGKALSISKALSTSERGVKDSPFFKWGTTAKDSAHFSKDLFSNTTTEVLLFDDAVSAEEANVDFKNGKAAKLAVTLLTRRNSGPDISAGEFDAVFKATGRALCATLGVRPTRTTERGKQLAKTEGWLWTTPHTLASLEYNVDAPKGSVGFLRLTLTPASARRELVHLDGIGNNHTTIPLAKLARSVKRDPSTGDVEIIGVPMRLQGRKGYCCAASCERLFRYLGQPCDMDEIAQLVATDAEGGTSPSTMYGALRKIDAQYNMRVKLLKIRAGYGLGVSRMSHAELEKAQRAVLGKLIRENIDQGLPLLWCVELAPGETGLSAGDDTHAARISGGPRVGHMRLITGYNLKTGAVIYTDSWGAGHERKVMSSATAEAMTTAVFSMAPSK